MWAGDCSEVESEQDARVGGNGVWEWGGGEEIEMSRPPAVRATKIDTRRINGGSELQMEFSRRGKQLGAPLSMHAQTGVDPWYRDLNDAYLRAPMRFFTLV